MIRINLLPGKKAKRAEAGQRHLVVMGAAVLLSLGAIVLVHVNMSNKLDEIKQQNRLIQTDIDRLKAELGDYDKVKGQRDDLLKQRKTIEALESGRTGPVFLMREISEILTAGKGPTFDSVTYQENLLKDPNAGFNASWEPKRVWLESYEEVAKNVKIRGSAKAGDDVAEFLRRLNMSVFFSDVNVDGTTQISAGTAKSAVKYVNFSLTASVKY